MADTANDVEEYELKHTTVAAPAEDGSDYTIAMNEPEHILTLGGVIKRGWFLFKFQSGKQLLAGVLGVLPMSIMFGFLLSANLLLSAEFAYMWVLGLVLFDVVYFCNKMIYVCVINVVCTVCSSSFVFSFLHFIYLPFLLGALVHLTVAAHNGEPLSVLAAFERSVSNYGQVFLAFAGVYLGTILNLYLFIVPGIYFLSNYGLAWTIATIERLGVSESFTRSKELLQGRKKVFLLVQLVFVAMMAVVFMLSVAFAIWWGKLVTFWPKFFITGTIMQVTGVVFVPYIPMLTAFYFDAVKRHRTDRTNSGINNL